MRGAQGCGNRRSTKEPWGGPTKGRCKKYCRKLSNRMPQLKYAFVASRGVFGVAVYFIIDVQRALKRSWNQTIPINIESFLVASRKWKGCMQRKPSSMCLTPIYCSEIGKKVNTTVHSRWWMNLANIKQAFTFHIFPLDQIEHDWNSLLRLSELVENNHEPFYCGHIEAFDQVSSPVFAVRNVQAKLNKWPVNS